MGEAARDIRDQQEFEPIKIDPEKDETYEFLEYDTENESFLALTRDGDIITIKNEDLDAYKRVALSTQEIVKLSSIEMLIFKKLYSYYKDGNTDYFKVEELVLGSEFEKVSVKYLADSISSFKRNINQLNSKFKIESKRGRGYRLLIENE